MKKSKFSEAQIAFILRQADEGTPIAEVCRKAGISDATFYNWKKRYGGLTPSEVKRMRQLEDENNRLKKIVADLMLDEAMLWDVLSKKALKPVRRRLVDEVSQDWKVSIRRACAYLRIDTSPYHYKSKRGDQAALKAKMKEMPGADSRLGGTFERRAFRRRTTRDERHAL
jgi:putative transposase